MISRSTILERPRGLLIWLLRNKKPAGILFSFTWDLLIWGNWICLHGLLVVSMIVLRLSCFNVYYLINYLLFHFHEIQIIWSWFSKLFSLGVYIIVSYCRLQKKYSTRIQQLSVQVQMPSWYAFLLNSSIA